VTLTAMFFFYCRSTSSPASRPARLRSSVGSRDEQVAFSFESVRRRL
jgi:hypothetical protein